MAELTIRGVADSWPDRSDYKWQCGESRPCWMPIASSVERAIDDATGRGCGPGRHDGRIVMRYRTIVVGPWQ